jgi:hypothetical protein
MARERNVVADLFYASVWVGVLAIMGYKAYKTVVESTESIGIHFKTTEEMIDGNP